MFTYEAINLVLYLEAPQGDLAGLRFALRLVRDHQHLQEHFCAHILSRLPPLHARRYTELMRHA